MNKLETKIAALLQPEGERKHINVASSREISDNCKPAQYAPKKLTKQNHHCDECTYLCRNCGERLTWSEHQNGFCTHPDPIKICDDPEDEAAYEASMGKAVVWFREIEKDMDSDALEDAIIAVNGIEDWNWVLLKAKPSEIFEIILTVLETK